MSSVAGDLVAVIHLYLGVGHGRKRKMLNGSAWLNTLPQVHLDIDWIVMYTLRRNQAAGTYVPAKLALSC